MFRRKLKTGANPTSRIFLTPRHQLLGGFMDFVSDISIQRLLWAIAVAVFITAWLLERIVRKLDEIIQVLKRNKEID